MLAQGAPWVYDGLQANADDAHGADYEGEGATMDAVELQAQLIALLHHARAEQQAMIDALTPQQRAAVGTPEHWAAKDVVAHVASWWRVQAERERAVASGEPAQSFDDAEIDRRNAETLARSRAQPWEQVIAEAQEAHDAQVAALQRLKGQQLFDTTLGGRPLWRGVLGNGFVHPQTHLAEFYRDQGDPDRTAQVQERLSELLLRHLPIPEVQGMALYNIACVYATTGRPAEAIPRLRAAFPLEPQLVEWSRHDADLDSLRALPEFQALYAPSRNSR